MSTIGRTVRAIGAVCAILGLSIGVPAALWNVGHQLLDGRLAPNLARSPLDLLLRPDDGTLLIAFLVAVGAIAWLMLAVSLVGELIAVATRRPAARVSLPGFRWSSSITAALVTAVVSAGPAIAAPALTADIAPFATETEPRQANPAPDPGPVHVVERRDTLWRIAETALGDPLRWREVYDLNVGREQPDGGRLTEASVLTVGWRLALPADADSVVRVAPGDTLSELAVEHLGDPALAEELFDLNTTREQPGGATLTDRDLIRPGWILTLPSGDDGPPPSVVEQPTPGEVPEDDAADDTEQPSISTTPATPERTAEPAPTRADEPVDETTTDDEADDEQAGPVDDGPDWALAAAGMSALVAGGVAVSLKLYRRRQLRHRPARHRIAVPIDEDGQAEWALRNPGPAAAATRTAARHLDLALRCLTAPDAAVDAPPAQLRTIRLTDADALITVTGDVGLPAPFSPTDDRNRWTLDADEPLPLTDEAVAGLCAPYPTLVSIGTDGDRTLMVDLEERRLLKLGGDPGRCTALLRHFAAELATSPGAEDTEIVLIGFDDDLAALNPERVVTADFSTALAEIDRRARQTRAALHRHGLTSVVDGRRRNLAPDSWLPTVVFVARHLDNDEHALLDSLDLADSTVAVAVLATGAPDLTVDDSGELHLDDVTDGPWTAVSLTPHAGTHLANLLGTTSGPPEPVRPLDHPGPWAAGMDEDGGLSARPDLPGDGTDDPTLGDRIGNGTQADAIFDDPLDDDGVDALYDVDSRENMILSAEPDDDGAFTDRSTVTNAPVGSAVRGPAAPNTDDTAPGAVPVDPRALQRLAVADHQDPCLDEDLAAWQATTGTPTVPMVAILGEPGVRAPGPPPATRMSWFTEVLVYLALHPAGVTAQSAATDLWPDGHRISPATIRHAFYGARRWSGRGLNGDPGASFVSDMGHDSTYRLRGHLLDWDLFRRLRKRAQARRDAGHAGAAADYEAALALIRGPVLTPLRPGGYAWLNNHDQRHDLQIPGFIVDAAHELVDLALAAGDTATARRAAERARLVDVDVAFDRPLTDLMRVAHAEDNRSELELYAAVLLDARGFDVPEELAPDSFSVLHELLPHGPRRSPP